MSNLLLRGTPIGKVKAILFDKDGTLSNSEEHLLLIASLRLEQALKNFKLDEREETDDSLAKLKRNLSKIYGLTSKGLNPDGIIAVASRDQNLISTATIFTLLGRNWPNSIKLANDIFNAADEIYANSKHTQMMNPLLPGALSFLKELKKNGIVCSLISNDDSKGIKNFLISNNLDNHISQVWSCENTPKKPDPNAVHQLCNTLGLKPKDCALIGDADSDLLMARQAGIELALGFTGGWKTTPLLTYQHHLIHHWDELSID